MIFVTVGTHEQPFDRLVECIDKLLKQGCITEDVVVQTGYSKYQPTSGHWKQFFSYQEMCRYVDEARIVITHGGPSSFIMPLQHGKVPIVIPRQKRFGEHVNDHQVEFCREVAKRHNCILLLENTDELGNLLANYDTVVMDMKQGAPKNNAVFCKELDRLIADLFR